MSLTWTIVVIVLVLGVIVSNVMLLKYSAKFKLPQSYHDPRKREPDELDQDSDAQSHDSK